MTFWTVERIERLKTLFNEGMTDSMIAADIGASRNTVCGKRSRLGLKRGPDNPVTQRKGRPSRARRAGIKIAPAVHIARHRTALGQLEPIGFANLRTVDVVPLGLTLADLPSNGCKYPEGDPPLFCGHTQAAGSCYCAAHDYLCHKTTT